MTAKTPGEDGPLDADTIIDQFRGRWYTLSNHAPHPTTCYGTTYPTGEHGFNVHKTLNPEEQEHIAAAPTAAEAKKRGQNATRRPDWDSLRHKVMDAVIAGKFATGTDTAATLLATGDALLIDDTTGRCDQTWGDCSCPTHADTPGNNHLGLALMCHRATLTGHTTRWPRVAVTGHRPHRIPPEARTWVQNELDRVVDKLAAHYHTRVALTGAAQGVDTWWAQAAIRHGMTLWAYRPFPEQANNWPAHARRDHETLLRHAARKPILGDRPRRKHYFGRNALLVRDADAVVAVLDPIVTSGGTAHTAALAAARRKPLITINPRTRETKIKQEWA